MLSVAIPIIVFILPVGVKFAGTSQALKNIINFNAASECVVTACVFTVLFPLLFQFCINWDCNFSNFKSQNPLLPNNLTIVNNSTILIRSRNTANPIYLLKDFTHFKILHETLPTTSILFNSLRNFAKW